MTDDRKVVLTILDGLTPAALEAALEDGAAPRLAELVERGTLGTAISTFPSLTPVCLSSIATGAHGDVHEIPHLVWWHRRERRVVEYGSSFAAARAAGLGRTLRDTLVGLNGEHLGARAVTLFEALADAGYRTAAVNFTAYRGRTLHHPTLPLLPAVRGPESFFFYNLFASERTGAPLSFRNRQAGTIDAYAAAVGRWLVTRDAFDFFLYYLSDYDYASHAVGPGEARDVLSRCDAAIGTLLDAAGGTDAFLERYAICVMADHGQSRVREVVSLAESVRQLDDTLLTASNRAAQLYRIGPRAPTARSLAERFDGDPAVDVVAFLEDGIGVVRSAGTELRLVPAGERLEVRGDPGALGHPGAPERVWAALRNPNAGEVLVSAADGWEFADLAGRGHHGGGSHGSLTADDSLVPVLTVGLTGAPASIVEVAPLILGHFGVEPPAYAVERAA